MKKTILILSAIILFLGGCKKFDEIEPSKVEMKNEAIERAWDYIKISGEYDYPVVLEAMTLYLSENEDMSGAKTYECIIDGKTFSVEADGLKDGTKYYRQYEYDNGYVKEKGVKGNSFTIGKPVVITDDAGSVTAVTAVLSGEVTNNDASNKIEERGFCWGTEPNPTIEGEHYNNGGSTGTGTSTFTHKLTDLQNNETYHFRTYARTNYGIVYGEEKSFKTVEITLPTVTTNNVTNITTTSAACGGNVTSDGNSTVTARGVCWSTSPNPTINDDKASSGSGTGSYTSNLTNLTENTTYYVRSYAINAKGTSYGEEKSFKTVEITLPTVMTNNVTNITTTSAACGGNVTSDGNGTVTARGVCWSTSQNPTINDNKTENGSGTGSFTSNLTKLTENTTYYVRAYATNEKGTSYGEEKSFKTAEITLPTVMTNNVTNITTTSATCGGNVTSDGNGTVTARGVCWSTSPNPTINDDKASSGSGTGSYTSNLTNLTENTTYYVRSYATNEKGTSYGEEKSFKTESLINGHDWVDLGLPSGLKWATCNVGANNPEDYGNYYAWGETTTKSDYSSSNSATYVLSISQLQSQGYIDGSGNLTPSHDAATANWGGSWRMPTKEEQQELLDNCTWILTTQNGVNGCKVVGPNGNHIFLPAAGDRHGSSLYNDGNDGGYWSSTPYDYGNVYGAYYLYFSNGNVHVDYGNRGDGLPVRPISE